MNRPLSLAATASPAATTQKSSRSCAGVSYRRTKGTEREPIAQLSAKFTERDYCYYAVSHLYRKYWIARYWWILCAYACGRLKWGEALNIEPSLSLDFSCGGCVVVLVIHGWLLKLIHDYLYPASRELFVLELCYSIFALCNASFDNNLTMVCELV